MNLKISLTIALLYREAFYMEGTSTLLTDIAPKKYKPKKYFLL